MKLVVEIPDGEDTRKIAEMIESDCIVEVEIYPKEAFQNSYNFSVVAVELTD